MIEDPLKNRLSEDAYPFAARLRSLAEDILQHSCCPFCILNATDSLEKIGELNTLLEKMKIEDPRLVAEREGPYAVKSKSPWQNAHQEEH